MSDILFTPLGVRLPSRYIRHYPHPPQEAFLWLDNLEALYGGAAGGGKSDALLMAALQYVDVPGYAAIIFRRISPDLHGADGLVPRSKEWLLPALGDRAWNGERLVWTFPSGATVRFGHMQYEDDKIKFQGHAYQFIGFDELTHFTESQYTYLASRLRKPDDGPVSQIPLRLRGASNPGGPGHEWVKRRFIDRQPNPDDEQDTPEVCRARAFIPARLPDNPSINQESYLRSLAALEPELRAQLLNGDWDARQPGDWFFDDRHLAAVAELGRQLDQQLTAGTLDLADDRAHLGIDWGEASHATLGLPLEAGGMLVAREYVGAAQEPTVSTQRMLALNDLDLAWGRARYDAAGVQSMRTFIRESQRILSGRAPRASKVAFGKWKGMGCMYLRRLARRAYGVHVVDGQEVPEGTDGAVFIPGPLPGALAVSPRCPELLRQLRLIERDPENPTGAWKKAEDQHGPDALVALVAPVARRHHDLSAGRKPAAEATS